MSGVDVDKIFVSLAEEAPDGKPGLHRASCVRPCAAL